ncbi:MAG: pilus assembly protein [Chloroflexi bacterium]|nr:MAG: pilus assembly protein [Chloroflexota bacterium]
MATVNGPNGGDSEGARGRILKVDMRCHPLSRCRGQAIVETALLLPILMLLVMGTADLGRVFYYSIAVTNAAREAARQGTYYDPTANPPANSYDDYADVLAAAQSEVPTDVTLNLPTGAPSHCLTGSPSSWRVYYPTQPNSGYVYICFDGNDSQSGPAQQTIQVNILYSFSPVTPLAGVVGADMVQVLASTTMQVQTQQ